MMRTMATFSSVLNRNRFLSIFNGMDASVAIYMMKISEMNNKVPFIHGKRCSEVVVWYHALFVVYSSALQTRIHSSIKICKTTVKDEPLVVVFCLLSTLGPPSKIVKQTKQIEDGLIYGTSALCLFHLAKQNDSVQPGPRQYQICMCMGEGLGTPRAWFWQITHWKNSMFHLLQEILSSLILSVDSVCFCFCWKSAFFSMARPASDTSNTGPSQHLAPGKNPLQWLYGCKHKDTNVRSTERSNPGFPRFRWLWQRCKGVAGERPRHGSYSVIVLLFSSSNSLFWEKEVVYCFYLEAEVSLAPVEYVGSIPVITERVAAFENLKNATQPKSATCCQCTLTLILKVSRETSISAFCRL